MPKLYVFIYELFQLGMMAEGEMVEAPVPAKGSAILRFGTFAFPLKVCETK